MTSPTLLAFMSFGFGELLIIGTVALLVFGGQLPDVMRNLGRAYARFKDGLNEVSRPVRDELKGVEQYNLPSPRREIERAIDSATEPSPAEEAEAWPGAGALDEEESDPPPAYDDRDEFGSDEASDSGPSRPPSFDADDDDLLTP